MTKPAKVNKEVEAKKTTRKQDAKVVEQKKSYRVPKCSVNFVVIEKFEDEMATLKLNRGSKVNDIMLALYAKHGTNLNPNVLANQIAKFKNVDKTKEDKDYCKISPNCVSWYKNHYNKELNKFVSTKKKGLTNFVKPFLVRLQAEPTLAEAKGFEPLYRLRGNRISSAGRYDHFDTLPYSVCKYFVGFGSVSKWSAFASLG